MSIKMRARLSAGISQRAGVARPVIRHKTKVHYPAKLSGTNVRYDRYVPH